MKLIEKLKQKNTRNCIDRFLVMIPVGIKILEGLTIIPEMPKFADYALLTSVTIGFVDMIYKSKPKHYLN